MAAITVVLPHPLRTLAGIAGDVHLEVPAPVTTRALLDALEARFPMLCGTIRDHETGARRAYVRFYACGEDLSHDSPDVPLPKPVVEGREPLLIIGAIAGGAGERVIGNFEVHERLGRGGMGEVYRARDRRLDRWVALKLLPEAGVSEAARARLAREARAVAALNHPHICTLHDIGEDGGHPYLVMELLEGETLHQRLTRGPVSVAELAQWGTEIADALQAAHAAGILHRDLKPGNIFLTQRGSVKVLDFGLAQIGLSSGDSAASDPDAPTQTAGPLTTPGTALGTLAYMAPEQARGESSDARSDLFSLGVVLYEMAAGVTPFRGRTALDISAAVLRETPPAPSSVRTGLPPMVDAIVAKCLEKDPDLRYQSAADLRADLRRLQRENASDSAAAPAPAPSSAAALPVAPPPSSDSQILSGLLRRHWHWPLIAVVVIAAGIWALIHFSASTPATAPLPVLQFRPITSTGSVADAVLSPDGKFLAYVDNGANGTSLKLLSVGSGSVVQIAPPGPGCCNAPSFSPDGNYVYYESAMVIHAVPVLGGAERQIATQACDGASFSPDGSQIAFIRELSVNPFRNALMVAHADGSSPRTVAVAPQGSGFDSPECWQEPSIPDYPAWSPDGHALAVFMSGEVPAGRIRIVQVADGSSQDMGPEIHLGISGLAWQPSGRGLLFTSAIAAGAASQLWSLALPSGAHTQLTDDLNGYTSLHLAANGNAVLVHGAPQYSLWTQAAAHAAFQPVPGGGPDQDGAQGVAWTPQGDLVTTRSVEGSPQVWLEQADGSAAHALVTSGDLVAPSVAPNGQILLDGDFHTQMWRLNSDGSGLVQLAHPQPGGGVGFPESAGDRQVIYIYIDPQGHQRLWTMPLAGGVGRELSNVTADINGNPVSPDGERVFAVGGDTLPERPFYLDLRSPSPAPRFLNFDFNVITKPYHWSADGRSILGVEHQGAFDNLVAVPIAGGQPVAVTHFTDLHIAAFAVARDGRLAISRGEPNTDAVLATGLSPARR